MTVLVVVVARLAVVEAPIVVVEAPVDVVVAVVVAHAATRRRAAIRTIGP